MTVVRTAVVFVILQAVSASAFAQTATGRVTGLVIEARTRADRVVVSPGARFEHSTVVNTTTTAPWLLTEWQPRSGTRLRAGTSLHYQVPTLDDASLARLNDGLLPEQAFSVDVGVEQRFGEAWRALVTGYSRRERDRLRLKNNEYRILNDTLIRPGVPYVDNALSGDAGGVDVILERRSVNGWSGWLSYTYGDASVTDESRTITGGGNLTLPFETFPSDYDQRHTVNIYSTYRWSSRTSVSGRFRYGSNFPIAAYVEPLRQDVWSLTSTRNQTRLPPYARVDLRADRTFTYRRRRLTLFLEVINVLNRDNLRAQGGGTDTGRRTVSGITERVFPILPSVGILIEF